MILFYILFNRLPEACWSSWGTGIYVKNKLVRRQMVVSHIPDVFGICSVFEV